MPPEPIVVGWKLATRNLGQASVRYRALLPVIALRRHGGVESLVMETFDGVPLGTLDVLVLVKALAAEDIASVRDASARGVAIVFDLCDNIFLPEYNSRGFGALPIEVWNELLPYLSMVIVPTQALAEVVRQHAGQVPVFVIPDGLETPALIGEMKAILEVVPPSKNRLFLTRLLRWLGKVAALAKASPRVAFEGLLQEFRHRMRHARFLVAVRMRRKIDEIRMRRAMRAMAHSGLSGGRVARAPLADRSILWFGNHGGEYASFGMLDLLSIRDALEAVGGEYDVELVVVSNHAGKFDTHVRPFAMPTRYVEWSPVALQEELDSAAVVVVPNSMDAFSACKSANRTVLALQSGVPVVATRTSAMGPLADVVQLDDFEAGLRLYLGDPERARGDLARARPLIESLYGLPTIAALWKEQLDKLAACRVWTPAPRAELVIVLNLAQDLDLAMPVAMRARDAGVLVQIWSSSSLLRKSRRVGKALTQAGIDFHAIPDLPQARASFHFPSGLRALLTVAETSLAPHAFTRGLTLKAQQAGVFVATMQHGFENVALTYSDRVHDIATISIAADRIYLWGGIETLHPRATASVRERCVSVGCTKPARIDAANLAGLVPAGKPVVGVFENLHWHRYSNAYRKAFVKQVQALAREFPHVTFLIKPHHAGMWLTQRYLGARPIAENIVVADPANPAWEPYTASALLGNLAAVITSPSTVALDAARHGMPTAVVALDLKLDNYSPLPLIKVPGDWTAFVAAALDQDNRWRLLRNSADFVGQSLATDDGAGALVADLMPVLRDHGKNLDVG